MLHNLGDGAGFRAEFFEEARERGQVLNVGVIDADLLNGGTRHPNLALLKMAGFCKGCGHNVHLIEHYAELGIEGTMFLDEFIEDTDYDVLILSQVFKFTVVPDYIMALIGRGFVFYGGTGFFEINGPSLPERVEHQMPDYTLYLDYIEHITGGDAKIKKRDWDDYLSYSIGFTTRGCVRHCAFCVNRLSNRVEPWAHVNEFLDPTRPRIYLWDDNILAAPPRVLQSVSGHDSSLFIDTPTGRIDSNNRLKIVDTLLSIADSKQIVLLFTPTEYTDEIRERFAGRYSTYRELSIDEETTHVSY